MQSHLPFLFFLFQLHTHALATAAFHLWQYPPPSPTLLLRLHTYSLLHNFAVTPPPQVAEPEDPPPHQITPSPLSPASSHASLPVADVVKQLLPLVIDAGDRSETVRDKLLSRLCHVGPAGDGDILDAMVAREARVWGQRDGEKRCLHSAGWLGITH